MLVFYLFSFLISALPWLFDRPYILRGPSQDQLGSKYSSVDDRYSVVSFNDVATIQLRAERLAGRNLHSLRMVHERCFLRVFYSRSSPFFWFCCHYDYHSIETKNKNGTVRVSRLSFGNFGCGARDRGGGGTGTRILHALA